MVKKGEKTKKKKKTKRKRKTRKKSDSRNNKINEVLVHNFVSLQSVMTKLSKKFDDLSINIEKLLSLFEISAKSFIDKQENVINNDDEHKKELKTRLDSLLDQNKTLAKGITLMEEKMRESGGTEYEKSRMKRRLPIRRRRLLSPSPSSYPEEGMTPSLAPPTPPVSNQGSLIKPPTFGEPAQPTMPPTQPAEMPAQPMSQSFQQQPMNTQQQALPLGNNNPMNQFTPQPFAPPELPPPQQNFQNNSIPNPQENNPSPYPQDQQQNSQ